MIQIDINTIIQLADHMASMAVMFGTTSQGYDSFLESRKNFIKEVDKLNELSEKLTKMELLLNDDIH